MTTISLGQFVAQSIGSTREDYSSVNTRLTNNPIETVEIDLKNSKLLLRQRNSQDVIEIPLAVNQPGDNRTTGVIEGTMRI